MDVPSSQLDVSVSKRYLTAANPRLHWFSESPNPTSMKLSTRSQVYTTEALLQDQVTVNTPGE